MKWKKMQQDGVLVALMTHIGVPFIRPMTSSLLKRMFGKGVNETKERLEGRNLSLIGPILLRIIFGKRLTRAGQEVMTVGKGVMRAGNGYNKADLMDKKHYFGFIF